MRSFFCKIFSCSSLTFLISSSISCLTFQVVPFQMRFMFDRFVVIKVAVVLGYCLVVLP